MFYQLKRLLLAALCSCLCWNTYGQDPDGSVSPLLPDVIPPSPTAASIARFGELPVNYYTGGLNLSIPLFTTKGRNLAVPISLSYASSGCKVDALASWVGDGWSAHAGGVISRTLRGMEDERPGVGFWAMDDSIPDAYPSLSPFLQWNPSDEAKRNLADGVYDAQPDIFSFNFLNYSGKFFIAPDGTVHGMPAHRLRIEYDPLPSPTLDWFKVTTPDGNVFLFEDAEETTSETVCSSQGTINVYKSSWYLSKIISADRNDTIRFTYGSAVITHPISRSETDYKFITNVTGNGQCQLKSPEYCHTVVITDIKYLTEITTLREKVNFFSNASRTDLNGARMLDSIVVERNGAKIRSFVLDHSYFQGRINQNLTTWPGNLAIDPNSRLRLDAIQEFGSDGTALPPYRFDYNTNPISSYGSFDIDHWGYYNGKRNNMLRPQVQYQGTTWAGANRDCDPSYAIAGMLEQVTYPTGGTVSFEYEGNAAGANNRPIGGLRLKKQIVFDGISHQNDMVKLYTYQNPGNPLESSGVAMAVPDYMHQVLEVEYEMHQNGNGNSMPVYLRECLHMARTSSSQINLNYTKGSPVGYKFVTESFGVNGKGGKLVMKFQTGLDAAVLIPPFTPQANADYKRGHLLAKLSYNAAGDLVQKETTTYDESLAYTIGGAVCSYKKKHFILDPGYQKFYFEKFFQHSEWVYPTESQVVQYDPVTGDSLARTTTMAYDNPKHFLPTRTFQSLSDGRVAMKKVKYTLDYEPVVVVESASQLTIGDMLAKNMVETVIEEQSWEGSDVQNLSLVAGKVNIFSNTSTSSNPDLDNIKPFAVWMLETDAPIAESSFIAREHFNANSKTYWTLIPDFANDFVANDYVKRAQFRFGEKGELLEQQLIGGAPTAYIWNEEATLPVAKIANAHANEVAFMGFERKLDRSEGGFEVLPAANPGAWLTPAFAGKYAFQLTNSRQLTWQAPAGVSGEFELSLWTTGGNLSLNSPHTVQDIATSNGWTLKKFTFTISPGQLVQLTGLAVIDEVRLAPADAQFELTYSFDQKERIIQAAGADARVQHFTYDELDRMNYVIDQVGHFRQGVQYNYKQ